MPVAATVRLDEAQQVQTIRVSLPELEPEKLQWLAPDNAFWTSAKGVWIPKPAFIWIKRVILSGSVDMWMAFCLVASIFLANQRMTSKAGALIF